MSDNQGGSFLSEAAASPVDGTPSGDAPVAPPTNGADTSVQSVLDGPPEWAPAKYWDAEKKSVRYEDMGRGYMNLEKLLGREKVPVPSDQEDRDGWDRWYKASGRPEKPDDYEFKSPELPKDLPYDGETEKTFRTWAHVNGLNKQQAANLYDGYVSQQLERHAAWHKAQQDHRRELETNLAREYGNKLESVKQSAGMIIRENADPEFHQYLSESGLGNDPRMVRFLAKIGSRMTGETKLKGAPQPQAQPQDFQRAIADFRDKHKEALFNKNHPNHDIRVKEFNKLFEGAYGNEPFAR